MWKQKLQLDATDDFYCRSSVASSWSFYFHILTTMHGQNHIKVTVWIYPQLCLEKED